MGGIEVVGDVARMKAHVIVLLRVGAMFSTISCLQPKRAIRDSGGGHPVLQLQIAIRLRLKPVTPQHPHRVHRAEGRHVVGS